MSSASGKQAAFSLDDIDSFMSKEPVIKSAIPIVRALPPQTRSKNTPKKRKTAVIAVPDDDIFEGLSTNEALAKMEPFIQQCVQQIRRNEHDMKQKLEKATRDLNETLQALEKANKFSAEKTMVIDKQRIEKEALEAVHTEALQSVKRSAAKVVYDCRIRMYEEATAKDFDLNQWDVTAWKEAVAKLSQDAGESCHKDAGIAEDSDKVIEETTKQGDEGVVDQA